MTTGDSNSKRTVAVSAAADNNRKKDAHHGTYIAFASSRLPLYHGCYAIILSGNRDDFVAVDLAPLRPLIRRRIERTN